MKWEVLTAAGLLRPHPPRERLGGGTFLHERPRSFSMLGWGWRGWWGGGTLPQSWVSILKRASLFLRPGRVTDNASVHYREGQAIHHSSVCVCVQWWLYAGSVALLKALVWLRKKRRRWRRWRGVGGLAGTASGDKDSGLVWSGGGVIYLVGGRGNSGSIISLMRKRC